MAELKNKERLTSVIRTVSAQSLPINNTANNTNNNKNSLLKTTPYERQVYLLKNDLIVQKVEKYVFIFFFFLSLSLFLSFFLSFSIFLFLFSFFLSYFLSTDEDSLPFACNLLPKTIRLVLLDDSFSFFFYLQGTILQILGSNIRATNWLL